MSSEWCEDLKLKVTLLRQVVFEDLAKAREGFVLASDLHLIYEVTPTYVDLEPDWGVFYQRYMELSPIDQVSYCAML